MKYGCVVVLCFVEWKLFCCWFDCGGFCVECGFVMIWDFMFWLLYFFLMFCVVKDVLVGKFVWFYFNELFLCYVWLEMLDIDLKMGCMELMCLLYGEFVLIIVMVG